VPEIHTTWLPDRDAKPGEGRRQTLASRAIL
jgi:hypothetical protein